MKKKVLAVILCMSLLIIRNYEFVNAASYTPLTSGNNNGYGECSISATSSWARTHQSPADMCDFSGTYYYIANYHTNSPQPVNQPISAGGYGDAYNSISITSSDRSNYIEVTHRIYNYSGTVTLATGFTDASYLRSQE